MVTEVYNLRSLDVLRVHVFSHYLSFHPTLFGGDMMAYGGTV